MRREREGVEGPGRDKVGGRRASYGLEDEEGGVPGHLTAGPSRWKVAAAAVERKSDCGCKRRQQGKGTVRWQGVNEGSRNQTPTTFMQNMECSSVRKWTPVEFMGHTYQWDTLSLTRNFIFTATVLDPQKDLASRVGLDQGRGVEVQR